jgi:hypothetical protein
LVNADKIKKKLPGLLMDTFVSDSDPDYERKRREIRRLQKQPEKFSGLFHNVLQSLDELDRAAEQAGFQHIYFDSHGELKRKPHK